MNQHSKAPHSPVAWILISLVLAYIPHAFWLPVWISIYCLGLWLLFLILHQAGWKTPGRFHRYLLIIVALVMLITLLGKPVGKQGGISLLALMLAIKPMEMKSSRDQVLTLFLGMFFLFTTVLFSQNFLLGIYLLLVYWFYLTGLFCVHHSGVTTPEMFRRTGIIILQGLPLAIILFLVFPRLPGSLVGFAEQNQSAVSGISDRMNPGSISNLAMSNQVVFRAEFPKNVPVANKRYWRVLVLRKYNGNAWTQGKDFSPHSVELVSKSDPAQYTVMLEPKDNNYLPALDMPITTPARAKMHPGFVLRRKKERVERKIKYKMRSALACNSSGISRLQKEYLLHVIPSRNPRTKKLCRSFANKTDNKRELIRRILNYFESREFTYTLQPERLTRQHSIDDFLFNTREGFCEHYAQATAWMLRVLDIPSRIVAGYQGGKHNPMGDYLIIRSSHAHAWVEAWIEPRGWTRIDPTGYVAPERIDTGVSATNISGSGSRGSGRGDHGWLGGPWLRIRLFWDSLNYQWYTWVVNYSSSKQRDLFSKFNPGKAKNALTNVFLISLGVVLLFLVCLACFLIRSRDKSVDLPLKIYQKFLHKLSKLNIPVYKNQGPRDLAKHAAYHLPELEGQIRYITEMYIQLRYAETQPREKTKEFQKAVNRFPSAQHILLNFFL